MLRYGYKALNNLLLFISGQHKETKLQIPIWIFPNPTAHKWDVIKPIPFLALIVQVPRSVGPSSSFPFTQDLDRNSLLFRTPKSTLEQSESVVFPLWARLSAYIVQTCDLDFLDPHPPPVWLSLLVPRLLSPFVIWAIQTQNEFKRV